MTKYDDGLQPGAEAPAPLTLADLADLPDPDALDRGALMALLERLERLSDELDDEEPDEDGEAHDAWEESIFEVAGLIDDVQSRIEELEEQEGA